ncbi:Protein of unknown function [Rhizobium sp. RU35A]|uniref:DUF7168 domain-containing protein n=1 Tax=Rhizobium sp. RU35A TaxID=1907414 RepID=UPI0009566E4C|nr:DUF2786 domain-containing protein [Rhizobium sp. RU35A]SIQ24352.1 Protein of unknown function [Rhizobium sp. RU35A]
MKDREKILAKIRALTAKTITSGCTEAEAIAAAEKAAALMREYGISESIVEIDQGSVGVKFNMRSPKAVVCAAIAYSINGICVHTYRGSQKSVVYVGQAPGPQIACYLHDVLHRAVETALKEFRGGPFYKARRSTKTRRKAVDDFVHGMAMRLARRVIDMFAETRSDEQRRRADAAAAELFNAVGVKQRERKTRFVEAEHLGDRAGRRVTIARGVSEAPVSGLIAGGDR